MSRVYEKEQQPNSKNSVAGISIRHARSADFSAIFALLEQLWPDRISSREKFLDIFRKGLDLPRVVYLCLLVNDRILGFCSLHFTESFWQEDCFAKIDEMVIDKNIRGRGCGTFLVRHVIDICKKQGCVSILLDSDFHRLKTHKFYAKLGFKKTGYLFGKNLG